jgi:ribonuclease Y
MFVVIGILIGLIVGTIAAVVAVRLLGSTSLGGAQRNRRLLLEQAERDAEATRREAEIASREDAVRLRAEVEQEVSDRRGRMAKTEERLHTKEEELERRLLELDRREQGVADREVHVKTLQEELKETRDREVAELQHIAGMTVEEAKRHLLRRSEELIRHELARQVRQEEEEARIESKRRARNLVADALQRVAASHAAETTVSVVELPSDDMKGRIIGKEGRNIRALESLTGVEIIIDDTPQAVVLSSFDGVRREVAKITLAKLIEDGRIHPALIEEMYYQ